MAEHARIAQFFAPLSAGEPGSFFLSDDAAVLTPPSPVVVTTDSVIVGVHVLHDSTAAQIAQKLMRRNLSDLAAMGATPWRYFLNLHTTPHCDADWFGLFSATLADEQRRFGLVLAGGDSTSDATRVQATMTCMGLVPEATLLRSNVQVGDDVYVSGTIGDAALGLAVLQHTLTLDGAARSHVVARYYAPEPRLALGEALRHVAHAAIDISDGLLADAAQLANASQVQLQLTRDAIPLSHAARTAVHAQQSVWKLILTGGDDYELLFTAAVEKRAALSALGVTRIGTVTAGSGVLVDGVPMHGGWEHR